MYENVGQKLKTTAKVILALGVICGIIGLLVCFVQLSQNNQYSYSSYSYNPLKELYVIGILASILLVVGSIVSSLICYGIGEAAENSAKALQKQIEIEQKLSEINPVKKNIPIKTNTSAHQWICQSCRNMISQNPCPFCGSEQPNFNDEN